MAFRIAQIGIIVEDNQASEKINSVLHEYSNYIVARLGVPYRDKKIAIMSIVLDAPDTVISALSGKLGMINNVSVKTVYSKNEY